MKKCMNCGTITQDRNARVCVECGSTRFAVRKKKEENKSAPKEVPQQKENSKFTDDYINRDEISVLDWVLILIQLAIPIWNVVFIIKTLANKYESEVKKNYIKAVLLMVAISTILTIVFSGAIMNMIVDIVIRNF